MEPLLSYRQRVITDDEVVFIVQLIAANPQSSRRNLSERLCLAWNWVQASGAPSHLGCRDRNIGWTPQARLANIARMGRMARRLSADWQALYANPAKSIARSSGCWVVPGSRTSASDCLHATGAT